MNTHTPLREAYRLLTELKSSKLSTELEDGKDLIEFLRRSEPIGIDIVYPSISSKDGNFRVALPSKCIERVIKYITEQFIIESFYINKDIDRADRDSK
jgi:hypothetical protein